MAHQQRLRVSLRSFLGPGLVCGALLASTMPAEAVELSSGVSLGGVLVGSKPRFAVTPHAAVAWRMDSGLLVAVHEMLSILPATDPHGVGLYNRTALVLGYATNNLHLSAGPSLSIYSMIACSAASLCGRVVGLSPGALAQASLYLAGPLGVSVSAGVDWISGRSLVLSNNVAATVIIGPVLRWVRRQSQ